MLIRRFGHGVTLFVRWISELKTVCFGVLRMHTEAVPGGRLPCGFHLCGLICISCDLIYCLFTEDPSIIKSPLGLGRHVPRLPYLGIVGLLGVFLSRIKDQEGALNCSGGKNLILSVDFTRTPLNAHLITHTAALNQD